MASNHFALVLDAKSAIDAVIGDTSVGRYETLDSLRELFEQIETMIDALETELGDEEAGDDE